MVRLANELRERALGLRAGDLVITGACTPPHPIADGDAMVADFGALGRVERVLVTVTPAATGTSA